MVVNLKPVHLACAALVCIVVYFEPVQVFGIKVSHLWKILTEAALVVFILFQSRVSAESYSRTDSRMEGFPRTFVSGLLYAIWPCAAALNYDDPSSSLFVFGQRVFVPLVAMACIAARWYREDMMRFLASVTVAVVLSSLPFLLGLIEPLGESYDLEYIFFLPIEAFVGIFQTPHGASNLLFFVSVIALALSMMSSSKPYKLIWIAVFVAAGYLLFKTCVRTGVLSFFIGAVVFVVLAKRISWAFAGALLITVGIGFIAYSIEDPQGVLNRLTGTYEGRASLNLDDVSSGRLMAWDSTLQTVSESDLLSFFVGNGPDAVLDQNRARIGMRIIAHNAFIDELAAYGVIGLLLLCNFLRSIYLDIRRIDQPVIAALGLGLLSGTLAFGVFQSFDYPLPLCVLVPFIAYEYSPSRAEEQLAWDEDRDIAVA